MYRPPLDHAGTIDEAKPARALQQSTNFGGITFLENVPVSKGAPNPPKHVSQFYDTISIAKRFEWQWRVAMAFKELPEHYCSWITMTYAEEPPSWEAARRNLKQWLQSVRNYHRRVLLPAQVSRRETEKMHYLIVEEEGSEKGRKHFHALVWMPYELTPKLWESRMLKWKHGFQKIKPVRSNDTVGLAIYIAKYATKAQGRTKCSSNLGLMTLITLLSSSSYQRLWMVVPSVAQKLLRRLSLLPNYPTSKLMMYLISRVKSSTISQATKPPKNPLQIGLRKSGFPSVNNGYDTSPGCQAIASSSEIRFSLVRNAVADIRTAISRKIYSELQLPGAALFGRPKPVSLSMALEPSQNTAIWYSKSNFPRCERARSKLTTIQMGESGGSTRTPPAGNIPTQQEFFNLRPDWSPVPRL